MTTKNTFKFDLNLFVLNILTTIVIIHEYVIKSYYKSIKTKKEQRHYKKELVLSNVYACPYEDIFKENYFL